MARSATSSLRRVQSVGPVTDAATVVRPIRTRELPVVVQDDGVRDGGESWIVMCRISFGLRPSIRRLDRVRRSVLRKELIAVVSFCYYYKCIVTMDFVCWKAEE